MTDTSPTPASPSTRAPMEDANNPIVDVIIPTNRGATNFLKDAVASVEAQTYKDWTLTIVDDGGPDPQSLARMFDGSTGVLVVRQEAAGTSVARNRGIDVTRNPLIVFLDDDDLWSPERLERQVRALIEMPQHVGAYCGGTYIDAAGRSFGEPWPAKQATSRAFLAGDEPIPRIVTLMVRREAVEAVGGFDPVYVTGQDLDFTLRLLQIGELAALQEALVKYRRHSANVSQPASLESRRARSLMLTRQIGAAEERLDRAAAILLRENYRRQRVQMAREAVRTASAAVRSGQMTSLTQEVGWMMRAPVAAASEFGDRLGRYMRSRRSRRN